MSLFSIFGDLILNLGKSFILGKKKKRSINISGEGRSKGLKFIADWYCRGYDEIVSLVAESIGDNVRLPGEVVVEILCNLPVKSLLRFKTVCKGWRVLINSDVFIEKHLHRPNPQLGGYVIRYFEKVGKKFFPVKIRYVVGACNGIVCLAASHYPKSLILFNPPTREFSFIPNEPRFWHFAGFCYLPKTQEYQIVFFTFVQDNRTHVDITTLTLGKLPYLRVAKNVSMPGKIINFSPATGGTTMYWLGLDYDLVHVIVICYDLVQRRFSKMNVPPSQFSNKWVHRSLKMFKGSVIMFVSPRKKFTFFHIWMLADDISNGKSWIKYRKVGPLERVVYPVAVCWDRWILCRNYHYTVEYASKNLFYYDLETDQVVDYCDFQHDLVRDTHPPIVEFINYVESLVTVNSLLPYVDTDFT